MNRRLALAAVLLAAVPLPASPAEKRAATIAAARPEIVARRDLRRRLKADALRRRG